MSLREETVKGDHIHQVHSEAGSIAWEHGTSCLVRDKHQQLKGSNSSCGSVPVAQLDCWRVGWCGHVLDSSLFLFVYMLCYILSDTAVYLSGLCGSLRPV